MFSFPEASLRYPEHLHRSHNDYPLAPFHKNIEYSDLSDFAKKCKQTLEGKKTHKARKLTADFSVREKYVLHHANLALYLSLGMELIEVHRVLAFTQEKFLEPFMRYCTDQRKAAKSEFRKGIFKLIANSCFGE